MINTLLFIYSIVGENFGIAIILFTILIRLITYPLTAQQIKSAQGMQELQKSKKWQDIQKKYKDDREKLAQEQMKIYKEMGINPLGSCLPLLIQFPIIIGLYQSITRALANTPLQLLQLTKLLYSFIPAAVLIPLNSKFLWMDLSEPERLYIPGLEIPVIGGIPVLTIIVVITTFLQSRLMTPATASPGDQGSQMTKMMNLYMPLFMGYISYTLASGLALYFVTSNLVGIVQYGALGRLDWRNLIPSRKSDDNEDTSKKTDSKKKKSSAKS
jgi:YidC/Oxa1 family membrane protein insertase